MQNKMDIEKLLEHQDSNSPINLTHKRKLWVELTAGTAPLFIWQRTLWVFVPVCVMIIAVCLYQWFPTPAVGHARWGNPTATEQFVFQNVWYETDEQEMLVILYDESTLLVQPQSMFRIISTTTNRNTTDALIELHQGSLEASVTKSLAHDLKVRTPNVELTVIGTKFKVTVSKQAP